MEKDIPCPKCGELDWRTRIKTRKNKKGYVKEFTIVFCARCRVIASTKWANNNRERMREHIRNSYYRHKEEINKKHKETYPERRDALLEYGRTWYKENREQRIAKITEWANNNREKINARVRERHKENPEYFRYLSRKHYWKDPERSRELARNRTDSTRSIRQAKRRALLYDTPGEFTKYDIELLREVQDGICAMPWCSNKIYPKAKEPEHRETVDHIVPLIRGGSNQLGNLRLVCQPCNSRKGPRKTREVHERLLRDAKESPEQTQDTLD